MVNVFKKGFRTLGIAESFLKNKEFSVLCGVVFRRDGIIDGVSCTKIRVGGLDATEGVLRLYNNLRREDINLILTNGCIISWFNVIDIEEVYRTTRIPIICLTYEYSNGIEEYIRRYFKDDIAKRLEMYKKLGKREKVYIKKGRKYVYVRFLGLSLEEVRTALNSLIYSGVVPEPLRIANLIARALLKVLYCE